MNCSTVKVSGRALPPAAAEEVAGAASETGLGVAVAEAAALEAAGAELATGVAVLLGGSTIPDLGAGDLVGGSTTVHVKQNTGVGSLVCLGHVGTLGREGEGSATGDLDGTAAVVELGLARGRSLVQTNHLGADKVVASLKVGEVDRDETLVFDEGVDSPVGTGQTILVDLLPDGALAVGAVVLGDVDHYGTLVRSRDGLIAVTGNGGGIAVVPLETDGGTSGNLDLVGGGLATVAHHGGGGDIEDGVVAVGGSLNGEVMALVFAVNDK
jgi:hypothetical protein